MQSDCLLIILKNININLYYINHLIVKWLTEVYYLCIQIDR